MRQDVDMSQNEVTYSTLNIYEKEIGRQKHYK